MTLDEEIKKFESNAEFERTHENLRGCQEFKKLAEWLKELKAYKEQEPCEDAISREAALEAILTRVPDFCGSDESGNLVYRNETASYIRNLPSVTPRQKTGEWIKLKEQPPKKHVNVLVKDIEGFVTCAFLPYTGLNFLENFSGEIIDDVVEWMELPAPYKAESEARHGSN